MEYAKIFGELNNEISELEAKPSYELFKKLYCSNYSLRNELEQMSRKYQKLQELVNDKSRYVERLYEIIQILRKSEIRIILLLKELGVEISEAFEHKALLAVSDNQNVNLEEICNEFDALVEIIRQDDINRDVLEELCDYNNPYEKKEETSTIKVEERYWEILKQYYYNLREKVFLNVSITEIKKDLRSQNIVYASHTCSQLVADLKQVRANNYIGKKMVRN